MRKELSPRTLERYSKMFDVKRRIYLGLFKESDKHLLKRINLKTMKIESEYPSYERPSKVGTKDNFEMFTINCKLNGWVYNYEIEYKFNEIKRKITIVSQDKMTREDLKKFISKRENQIEKCKQYKRSEENMITKEVQISDILDTLLNSPRVESVSINIEKVGDVGKTHITANLEEDDEEKLSFEGLLKDIQPRTINVYNSGILPSSTEMAEALDKSGFEFNAECKYCHDYTQKINAMSKDNAWFSLFEHYLEVSDDRENGNILSFRINYCPMCGRKLN